VNASDKERWSGVSYDNVDQALRLACDVVVEVQPANTLHRRQRQRLGLTKHRHHNNTGHVIDRAITPWCGWEREDVSVNFQIEPFEFESEFDETAREIDITWIDSGWQLRSAALPPFALPRQFRLDPLASAGMTPVRPDLSRTFSVPKINEKPGASSQVNSQAGAEE
jgi:hypothetical protein